MSQISKLEQITDSISLAIHLWQEKIWRGWLVGRRAGADFMLNEMPLIEALQRDGFSLLGEIDGLLLATNYTDTILAVNKGCAVDITDELIATDYRPVTTWRNRQRVEPGN